MTAKGKSRGQNWSEHETQAVILVKDWLLFLTYSTQHCIVLHMIRSAMSAATIQHKSSTYWL